jgi:histidine ammonia-lyase
MELRPHHDASRVASSILAALQGSRRITSQGEIRVQDAYSIRCIPQVHGASWSTVSFVSNQLAVEMNAATDNPLILDDGRVISGGHFHGQPVALAMDFLKLGAAEWANISERRTERLVNPQLSGNKAFLANQPGLESGLMIAQYVAASLVSENKVLAHPASVDSIPSSANQEDHVSMGTIASRQVREIIQNAMRVVAIECICASQFIFLDGAEDDLSPVNQKRLASIRAICPPLLRDESISEQIEKVASFLLTVGFDA